MHNKYCLFAPPSREQEKSPGGVKLLTLEARPRRRAPQQDAAPATWLSWLRMTYEPWQHGPPGSWRRAAHTAAVATARLCLLPGWTQAGLRQGFCRMMKEPEEASEGIMGCSYKVTCF